MAPPIKFFLQENIKPEAEKIIYKLTHHYPAKNHLSDDVCFVSARLQELLFKELILKGMVGFDERR